MRVHRGGDGKRIAVAGAGEIVPLTEPPARRHSCLGRSLGAGTRLLEAGRYASIKGWARAAWGTTPIAKLLRLTLLAPGSSRRCWMGGWRIWCGRCRGGWTEQRQVLLGVDRA